MHIQEKLFAYLNHELPQSERQEIAEHLLNCPECRAEHDEIKLGAALATNLKQTDAPETLWCKIENALNQREQKQILLTSRFSLFNPNGLMAAASLLIVFSLGAVLYFGLLKGESENIASTEPVKNQNINVETPQMASTPNEISTTQNANTQFLTNADSNVQIPAVNLNQNVQTLPKINPVQPNETIAATQNNLPSWNVETIAGAPTAGSRIISQNGKLAVGQFLETDANSRARVQVANIGQVEIAPNSRVQLVKTQSTEHRLSLQRGVLQAKIIAPPRLFIVDTPSAVAVDLGCEYTLEVDKEGNSRLHVTSGFVALERGGRESIVPAGAICLTRRGKGLGTPFSEDASQIFQNALVRFDFENGGSGSLEAIIKEAEFYDALSLWHLLSRTERKDRERVFDRLAGFVKPPASVSREGVLRLDKKMLDAWWNEIENVWFG